MKNKKIIVYITASSEDEGVKIAKHLVENRRAACCNIVPKIRSIYRWEGKLCDDEEVLLIVKTMRSSFEKLKEEVKKIHSYSVPEIIGVRIKDGLEEYLDWIESEVEVETN